MKQMKHIKLFEEFVNEARSIEKIEKDRTRVINDMAEMVTNWKAAKAGKDKEAEESFLQRLKDLTAKKKDLEKELTVTVSGKDRFIELVISESNAIFEGAMSEIDLLAKEAKNFKDFVKEFKKEYSDITDAGDTKELEKWLKSVYDAAINESVDIKKTLHDHWFETYGKQFIDEYPSIAKILKTRPVVTRAELARIWEETHDENFEKTHPKIWDKLD
jgi:predicted DNA binding CopG/RHH family protein